ncbi:MAG TPA: DUF4157 domain-containing protein [Pyrinomonadaceae bacterium]
MIFVHAGSWSEVATRVLRVAAITLGRHIFVSRQVVRRNARGQLTMPGWLLAHEAAHVRQFQQAGFLPFLFNYGREFLALLARDGKYDARARTEAYIRLAREREAREVEAAYLEWRVSVPTSPD